MNIASLKAVEVEIRRMLETYVLADTDSIKRAFSTDPYTCYETYENYIKTVDKEKRQAYLSMNGDARHLIVAAFITMIDELDAVDEPADLLNVSLIPPSAASITEIEKIKDESAKKVALAQAADRERIHFIVDEVAKSNDPCILQFMYRFVSNVQYDSASLLAKASDPKRYFKGRIEFFLHAKYKNNSTLLNLVNDLFDNFLKALAYVISRHVWFDHSPINKDRLLAVIFSHGLNPDLVEKLSEIMETNRQRVSKPKKKPEAAKSATSTPDSAKPAEAAVDGKPAEASSETVATPAANVSAVVTESKPIETSSSVDSGVNIDLNALIGQTVSA